MRSPSPVRVQFEYCTGNLQTRVERHAVEAFPIVDVVVDHAADVERDLFESLRIAGPRRRPAVHQREAVRSRGALVFGDPADQMASVSEHHVLLRPLKFKNIETVGSWMVCFDVPRQSIAYHRLQRVDLVA